MKPLHHLSTKSFTNYLPADISQSQGLWNEYLLNINSSLSEYQGCDSYHSNCSCHSQVIDSDLDVWVRRGGIQRDEFDNARDKMYGGVHYQIINHKLYRSKDCVFQSR